MPGNEHKPRPDLVPWQIIVSGSNKGPVQVHFFGDSLNSISWINGTFNMDTVDARLKQLFRSYQQCLFDAWYELTFVAKDRCSDFFSHIHRDFNKIADDFATSGVLAFGKTRVGSWQRNRRALFARIWFDGGCREEIMGSGVWLEAADRLGDDGLPCWVFVCGFGTRLRNASGNARNDSVVAEAVGCGLSLCLLCEFLSVRDFVFTPHCNMRWACKHAVSVWQSIEGLLAVT